VSEQVTIRCTVGQLRRIDSALHAIAFFRAGNVLAGLREIFGHGNRQVENCANAAATIRMQTDSLPNLGYEFNLHKAIELQLCERHAARNPSVDRMHNGFDGPHNLELIEGFSVQIQEDPREQ